MDSGYMRPRYNGYLHFQDHAGQPLQDYLLNKISAEQALEKMNSIYRQRTNSGIDKKKKQLIQ